MKHLLKHIVCLLPLLLLSAACSNKWEYSGELGVNSTRINISNTDSGEFVLTVYSNAAWNVAVSSGASWLHPAESSGSGIGYVHFTYDGNPGGAARYCKVYLSSADKDVSVSVVQSGQAESAAGVSDTIL